MHHFDVLSLFTGGFGMVVLAYAVRTIPQPRTVWARWAVGVLQFAVSNLDKGQAALAGPPASTSPAEQMKP
jgi:hypothetical protein